MRRVRRCVMRRLGAALEVLWSAPLTLLCLAIVVACERIEPGVIQRHLNDPN